MPEFHFLPLKKKKEGPIELYLKIYSNNLVRISKYVSLELGFNATYGSIIYLYEDPEKRTMAFKVENNIKLNEKPKHARLVKPIQIRTGGFYFAFGIAPFLKQLTNPEIPSKRLEIKKYNDPNLGKLYYFTVAKAGKQDVNKAEDNSLLDETASQ